MTTDEVLLSAKILVVDDEYANTRYLEVMLQRAGYSQVFSTIDAREALPLFHKVQPDIVLLDLNMPYLDGFAVMAQLTGVIPPETYLPILVLTADVSQQTKQRALKEGAKDFLTKPLDMTEVFLRVSNLLQTRFQHQILEAKVKERTRDLQESQLETLQRLALASEYRDDDTGQHTKRVGQTAARLAEILGLPAPQVALLKQAAPLHDVGKIGVSDTILLKPGKLTNEEFATMQKHTTVGGSILSGSGSLWLQMAEEIALSHHERWDGKGYPAGLKGEAISLVGRIVAVADVFDALTNERPYKKAWTVAEALAEIKDQSGRQFDPKIVDALLQMKSETST